MKRRPRCPADLLPEEGAASHAGSLPENRQGANKIALGGARDLKTIILWETGSKPTLEKSREHSLAPVEALQSKCRRASASHAPALSCFAGARSQLCYVQVTPGWTWAEVQTGGAAKRSWRQHQEQGCSVDLKASSRRWSQRQRPAACGVCPRASQQMG